MYTLALEGGGDLSSHTALAGLRGTGGCLGSSGSRSSGTTVDPVGITSAPREDPAEWVASWS